MYDGNRIAKYLLHEILSLSYLERGKQREKNKCLALRHDLSVDRACRP